MPTIMDPNQRGRSPSQRQQPHISQNNSPSPHAGYQNVTGLGLDGASLVPDFNHNAAFDHSNNPPSFDLSPNYLSSTHSQYPQQSEITNHTFLQAQALSSNAASPQFGPRTNIYPQDNLALASSAADDGGFNAQGFQNNALGAQSIDPSILLDTHICGQQLHDRQSIDPTNLMNQMSTAAHSPTPPHLLHGDMRHSSNSPHASPSINQGAFAPSGHSRQQSLDPSAAFAHHNEWHGMQFRGHRRAPSDTYSDVSSSAQPSPYLGNADGFDDSNASPLLGAQQDPMFQDVLNFGQFSLSDNQAGISPGHSPAISPRLMPQQQQQQQLPPFTASNNYGLAPMMNNRTDGMDMFPGTGQEPFPALTNDHAPDYGASDQMSPPEINIDFAPPSRQQSFEPPKPEDSSNALSPPDRNRSRNRMRAKSDPFSSASMRAGQAASPPSDTSSLHPDAAKLTVSRPSTPGGVGKTSRRSSTSSIPHRDYMLGLADPNRPNPAHPASTASSPGGHSESAAASVTSATGSKRTQKHPATFQCSLCPKRFTRAYNLRSHLRTHTDERPFVCSVCGKAFARQHDRKRHEGLHSGEKKFVCRGVLKDGGSWGCSRRFARADALGRHFRSEAGRVCIRPLLEEEAAERGLDLGILSGQARQQQQQHHQQHQPGMDHFNPMMQSGQPQGLGMMMPQHPHGSPFDPLGQQPGLGVTHGGPMMGFTLPQSLLQQYPALAGIQWDALPPSNNDDNIDDDAISGRSSFDAQSSGGDMYDDNGWRNEQTLSDYDGRGG